MSAICNLTAKSLRELTKRGYTIADFCDKYQCTEEELRARLYKILCNNERVVNEAFNEILANSKKKGKPATIVKKEQKTTSEEVLAAAESTIYAEKPDNEPIADSSTPDASNDLEAKRERLRKIGLNLKDEYAEYDRSYSDIASKVISLESEITNLEDKLARAKLKLGDLIPLRDKCDKKRNELRIAREANQKAIAELDEEIRERDAIQLIACEDGKIEVVNDPSFVPDDTSYDDMYSGLVNDAKYENLRAKDIRLLARALTIIANAPKDRLIKVTFDSDEAQRLYDEFPIIK